MTTATKIRWPHTVSVEDIDAYRAELALELVQAAGSFGYGEAKSLSMTTDGSRYVVMDQAVTIYDGPSVEAAVARYNEA